MRQVLNETTQRGFTVDDLFTQPTAGPAPRFDTGTSDGRPEVVAVTMQVRGKKPASELAAALAELDLVDAVIASDGQGADE